MKLTKKEIIFLIILVSLHIALNFLYRLLEETFEPRSAFILFTSFYGLVLMILTMLYGKGTIHFAIFNHEERHRKTVSNLGIFVSFVIMLMGFLVYFLPHDHAIIACNILILLAGTIILITNRKLKS